MAGKPFNVQIVAKDSEGHTDTSYSGSVDIFAGFVKPLSGSKLLTPDTADFIFGVADVIMTYPDAGTIKITVKDKDEFSKVGSSGDVLFLPDSFSVSAGPVQVVGKNFLVTVQALSADGKVAPNYEGPATLEAVVLSPPGTSGTLNPSEISGQFQNGVAGVDTSYDRWGSIDLKVFDKEHPEQSGQSAAVNFIPRSLSVSIKAPSASRNSFRPRPAGTISPSLRTSWSKRSTRHSYQPIFCWR